MRLQKTTALLLTSFMWLLMMKDYRDTKFKRNTWDSGGKYTESRSGWVSTGLWYKTKEECEKAAEKSDIKYGNNLCVQSTPTK